jgi:hypothetical protein
LSWSAWRNRRPASTYFTLAEQFSINILGEWQREVSIAFASRSSAKLQAMNALTPGVPPLVEGSLANLLCERVNLVDAGDHAILIGGVTSFKAATGQPLGYFRGGYVGFGLAVRSLELMATPLLVGGLLEHDGRVVLCRRPGAPKWEVPSLPLRPGQQHSTLIRDVFARLEIRANTSFLYSVFQEEGNAHTTMIFSVEADGPFSCGRLPDGTETASFESGDEPWNLVEGSMTQGMLTRFFREKSAGCFGIYCDTSDGGRVAVITDKPQHWTEWNPGLHQS